MEREEKKGKDNRGGRGRGKRWKGKAGEERVKRESRADVGREGLRSSGC